MGARGEGSITVDGEQLPILLTNRALAEVEKATDFRAFTLAIRGVEGIDLSINVLEHLMRAGLEYARRDAKDWGHSPYTIKDAQRIIDEVGIVPASMVILNAYRAVMTYGADADGRGGETDNPPE